jgi:DNA relaxase NicK
MKISEESKIQMPFKTVLSLIAIVAVGTMSYFGIQEKINQHSTRLDLMEKDLELNTEFRIKWPRGQMGSLPADQEQFLLIESILKDIMKINKALETGMHNNVNISRLQKDMDKVQKDIEKLKDSNREMHYKNGK